MNDASSERRERLEILLADEAVGQLSEEEQQELAGLLIEYPEVDRDSFARAAAAFDLAFVDNSGVSNESPMPESLRRMISQAAPEHVAVHSPVGKAGSKREVGKSDHAGREEKFPPSRNGKGTDDLQLDSTATGLLGGSLQDSPVSRAVPAGQVASAADPSVDLHRGGGFDPWRWMGWVVATAAMLCLVLLNFSGEPVGGDPGNALARGDDGVVTRVNLQERFEDLLGAPSTKRFAWAPGPTPLDAEVSGGVVWNQEEQTGFMTFDGLPINDPQVRQYQLWIIDPLRDEHPIDGGVFDISSEGRVVVPIDPKLEVLDPKAFAITIEKPGGVVVSDQSQLPLLAAVE